MKLSVIIVNYNVKYYIHQCLTSLNNALFEFEKNYGNQSSEVIIVDNNSYDGSCEMIKKDFSRFILVKNKENLGFSKANNQGISKSKGEYILLLNPDTLIAEDTLVKVVSFMDKTQDAGGVGVKMINGTGIFLPESKRSFPYPSVSFYKIFGLSKLFPKIQKFGKYHLSYLNENEINEVDVLSGAFMCIRKKTIEKVGELDERFFMYGEDIDYSYRIKKANYKNYYFPKTTIIHYKGESTKKESLNYVLMFYNAMLIFARKHFSNSLKKIYGIFIKIAIIFRAGLSFFNRITKELFLPFVDFIFFFLGFYIITPIWETFKFKGSGGYPDQYYMYAVPLYILIWIMSIYVTKGYKRPVESKNLFRGIILGSLLILIIYSLLSEEYRYSRILLIFGSLWAIFISWLSRVLIGLIGLKSFSFNSRTDNKVLIVCDIKNKKIIEGILNSYWKKKLNRNIYVYLNEPGDSDTLQDLIRSNKINVVVYDYQFLGSKRIIKLIEELNKTNTSQKIFQANNSVILGAKSILTENEIYFSEINIKKPEYKRRKRFFDVLMSLLLLLFFPFILLIIDERTYLIENILNVLKGRFSWVGYIPYKENKNISLPDIKKGILYPDKNPRTEKEILIINANYASNYTLIDDIYVIYKSFNKIGHKNL